MFPMETIGELRKELNYSLDESLIELQQIIASSEQRGNSPGWQRVLDRPIEVHRLRESSNQHRQRFWADPMHWHKWAPGVMPIHDRGDDFMSIHKDPRAHPDIGC